MGNKREQKYVEGKKESERENQANLARSGLCVCVIRLALFFAGKARAREEVE